MIHAKTSVADGIWCRVGSSNLNAASLLGNWEIDIGVMDGGLAGQLEGLFMADLASSVEIVLPRRHAALKARERRKGEPDPPRHSLEPEGTLPERLEKQIRAQVQRRWTGSNRLRLADLVRAGAIFGDAIAGHRPLGREDRTVLGTTAAMALVVAAFAVIFPWVIGWIFALILGWLGLVLGTRAFLQARRAGAEERQLETYLEGGDRQP